MKQYYNANVICFEPNPESIAECKKHLTPDIPLIEMAVSDFNGVMNFYPVVNGNYLASSIYKADETYFEGLKQVVIKVETTRLDTYISNSNITPDLLCMDVQGASLKVLKGLGDKLKDIKYIITEIEIKKIYEGEELLPAVKQFMDDNGFELKAGIEETPWFGTWLFVNKIYL